ncbi:pilus assembly protein CpaE [Melghirimyces profundicolus]|uniref:Pilus assembly protein CpaE n=1 Tax=Melghirimyces profundicolus TaxID=1242148 RepID=A0A2T6BGU7_9BACL|nr:AAA family ATPase [Melghirimyces profundicolus]PTX55271.1 pilus assembly protein CpaE [Melghirimyces profundicolus]
MSTDVKLLIVSEEVNLAEDIRARVSNTFPNNQYLSAREVKREIVRIQPDIVLLHEPKDESGLQLLHYIKNELTTTWVIYLTESRDPIRARDVNRAGAFDILFLPDEIMALSDVLNRAVKAKEAKQKAVSEGTASFSWGRGQVITFYGGRGGCGRSLVASTLAQTIQLDSNSSVLLVDLNLQYGGIETYMNVENSRSIYDLTPVLQELNDNHIRNVTSIERNSQVEVLVSPCDAEIAEQVTEEHIQRLLRAARLYYDYILVDLPISMNTMVYSALEEADRMFYVMTPDAPSLRILNRVMELFNKLGVDPRDRFEILLNRISRDRELTSKDVKQYFEYPIVAEIREDTKKVQQMINRGKPLRASRRERGLTIFSKDIQKLARWLLTQDSSRSVS